MEALRQITCQWSTWRTKGHNLKSFKTYFFNVLTLTQVDPVTMGFCLFVCLLSFIFNFIRYIPFGCGGVKEPQHPRGHCHDNMASNQSSLKNCLYPNIPHSAAKIQ